MTWLKRFSAGLLPIMAMSIMAQGQGVILPQCTINPTCPAFYVPSIQIAPGGTINWPDGSASSTTAASFNGGTVNGVTTFQSSITVAGRINAGPTGIKWADNTVSTSATGGASVSLFTNASLVGDGSSPMPLGVNASSVAVLSGGFIQNSQINGSSITKQGNVFNGALQLVQMTASNKLPAVDGSNLINLSTAAGSAFNGGTVANQTTFQSSVTVHGATSLDGGYITTSGFGELLFNGGNLISATSGGTIQINTTSGFPYVTVSAGGGSSDASVRVVDSSFLTKVNLNSNGPSWFAGGRLGIGTAVPAQALDVLGNANVSGSIVVAFGVTSASAVIGGVTFVGAHTNASLRALSCTILPCQAQSTTDFDIYTATGNAVGQWRNSRLGTAP